MARNACTECRHLGTAVNLLIQRIAPSETDAGFQWGHQLSSNNSGFDIGTGTPSELLREGELTQTLLLLYFQNFNDIHFMFDQTIFLRRFVLGDVPKILLFAMMALGIRYSHAPFQSSHLRPHWGEPLYHQARHLLKEDFDHPSLTTIQVYVLLATYNLTFGGTRKAWIFLNFARSFVSILKLDQPASDMDPVQAELCRRLIATVALMENTLPPWLDKVQSFPPIHPLPQLYSEEEFDIIKNSASVTPSRRSMPCVIQEILILSEIYYESCQLFETPTPKDMTPSSRNYPTGKQTSMNHSSSPLQISKLTSKSSPSAHSRTCTYYTHISGSLSYSTPWTGHPRHYQHPPTSTNTFCQSTNKPQPSPP